MKSVFSVFKRGLQKTRTSVARTFGSVFNDQTPWTESDFEDLEAMLIAADFGPFAAKDICDLLRDKYARGLIATTADMFKAAADEVAAILKADIRDVRFAAAPPTVILLVGVNGSGKTTTAGKLAKLWGDEGSKVMLAACDTFRAAAVDQLNIWAQRCNCAIVTGSYEADPASVAFDATASAVAEKTDILLIDSAGRQHTKKPLMDELAKINRSIAKACPNAPHEVWLTVDASLGGNSINQVREFSAAVELSGLVLTKLDGSSKGGMALALKQQFDLPVLFAGFGEQPEDLQKFDPEFYANAIFE